MTPPANYGAVQQSLQDSQIKRDQLQRRCVAQIEIMQGTATPDARKEKEAERDNLQHVVEALEKQVSELEAKEKETAASLEAAREEEKTPRPFDVDKETEQKDLHRRQLLECVALDMAIEDMFIELDKALGQQAITLDEFIKVIRFYAEEQFNQRALTERIRDVIKASSAAH